MMTDKRISVSYTHLDVYKRQILTQRYFPANRADKVDWAGHADLVEGPDGKYYGCLLYTSRCV